MAKSRPTNSELEYGVEVTLGGALVELTPNSTTTWSGRSGPLSAGADQLQASLYLQDRRRAESLVKSINEIKSSIASLSSALMSETDPDRIAELKLEISQDELEIARIRELIRRGRTFVGTSVGLLLNVQ